MECGGYKKDFKWRPFEETNVAGKVATAKPQRSQLNQFRYRGAPVTDCLSSYLITVQKWQYQSVDSATQQTSTNKSTLCGKTEPLEAIVCIHSWACTYIGGLPWPLQATFGCAR